MRVSATRAREGAIIGMPETVCGMQIRRRALFSTLLVVLTTGLLLAPAAAARPALQTGPFSTPTPGPDGRIIYIMQEGDTLWTVAALAGITLEELMALNGIQASDAGFIAPGTELQLGLAGPVVATQPPGATSTPPGPVPTPTAITGTGEICVLLFGDENGDARWSESELPLAGGQLSVADVNGTVVGEWTTDGSTELDLNDVAIGHCFTELQFGDYNVSAGVPPDHNATTAMNIGVRIEPGETKFVAFGAQPSGASAGGGGGGRSTLLGLVGAALILAAAGLAFYASRFNRTRSRLLR